MQDHELYERAVAGEVIGDGSAQIAVLVARNTMLLVELARVEGHRRMYTQAYRDAPSGEGPLAETWKDKPDRLVYDLCREIERLRSAN